MNDPLPPQKREAPGRRISIALAVAVHVMLAIFLIYGIRWQSQRPEAVEVEVVPAVPAPAAEPAPPPPPPPMPPMPPEPPEPKPEPKVEPAPPPPPKPEIAVKAKKEKPKPAPKEEARPRFDPSEMLKRDEKDLAARLSAEAATKELAAIEAAKASAARNKAAADYLARLRGKIRGNIVVPPDVKGNPEAVFDVTQLPTGDILGVKLGKTSGHPALDAAIERAILKSSPLPKPSQAGLFERNLELKFRPLEE